MKRKLVESSVIRSVGYNSDKQVLELEFTSTKLYQYLDVPGVIYEELMKASSHGTYFNDYIKDEYLFVKVRD